MITRWTVEIRRSRNKVIHQECEVSLKQRLSQVGLFAGWKCQGNSSKSCWNVSKLERPCDIAIPRAIVLAWLIKILLLTKTSSLVEESSKSTPTWRADVWDPDRQHHRWLSELIYRWIPPVFLHECTCSRVLQTIITSSSVVCHKVALHQQKADEKSLTPWL